MKKRVLLGMSGGIDSSVAAILLKQQGFEVVGLTLRTWSETDTSENTPEYIKQTMQLAEKLSIKHYTADVRSEFYNQIVTYFKNEYLAGHTPHPCARCNPKIKWKTLLDYADKLDCQHIATGHYNGIKIINNQFYITIGSDADKEQSFFLWGLEQDVLSRAIFPLSNLTKTEIREIAINHKFNYLTQQKESIGICFMQQKNYRDFLKRIFENDGIEIKKGNFIDKEGNIIDRHEGIPFYTIGQRRGLGLTPDKPLYVSNIDIKTNNITLCNLADMYKTRFSATNYNIVNKNDFKTEVDVRIRYRKQNAKGFVTFDNDKQLTINLIEPEWGIAPGQSVAFYRENVLLGGGIIC